MTQASSNNTAQRETEFHDAWANNTSIESVLVRECFEAPTAMENQFILSQMGELKGKRLLDVGSGLGESSVYFALQGARVTVSDSREKLKRSQLLVLPGVGSFGAAMKNLAKKKPPRRNGSAGSNPRAH